MAAARGAKVRAERAQAFARTFVALKEALLQEGVTEAEATETARSTAQLEFSLGSSAPTGPSCPLCGK